MPLQFPDSSGIASLMVFIWVLSSELSGARVQIKHQAYEPKSSFMLRIPALPLSPSTAPVKFGKLSHGMAEL